MIKRKLRRIRRLIFEALGSDRYSWPALNSLDHKIVELFSGRRSGVFIEVGGNDGYSQSNTYYLERFLNWRGVLVEPIPRLYKQCVIERPNSEVYNCALVADSSKTPSVKIHDVGLMSIVKEESNILNADEHKSAGLRIQGLREKAELEITGRTFTEVLNHSRLGSDIDFLSLDVEGYELEVLKGLDLNKFKPKYILLEVRDEQPILQLIGHLYQRLNILSESDEYADIIYVRRL